MSSLATPNREDLLKALREVGLARGDLVYVASSMAAFGLMKDPINDMLWALREAVGPEGTLVMPAFNFAFCQGETFDRENTPSQCGVLSEAFRLLPAARRTWAPPFHSVAAVGPLAEEIGSLECLTSFGRTSVFEYLRSAGAKHLLIGCGYHEGVAHFHWMEEKLQLPYRYWKKFEGRVSRGGSLEERVFFMFARRSWATLDMEPLGQAFAEAGHVRSATVGLSRLRLFSLEDFEHFVTDRLKHDPLALVAAGARNRPTGKAKTPLLRVHHVGIASWYIKKINTFLEDAGLELTGEGLVPGLGVNCKYLGDMGCKVELVEPADAENCVAGHLRGSPTAPLHHLAFKVDDLDEALAFFRERGYVPLDGRFHMGPSPWQRVVFLNPLQTGGLLVELVADDGGKSGRYGGDA